MRHWVYGAGFFLNASLAIAAYLNSSLLSQFLNEQQVGLIYSLTYLITFAIVLYFHKIIERTGVYQAVIGLVFLGAVIRIILAGFANLPLAIPLLIINLVLSFLLVASLDLYLEHLSENSITGWIRGLFLALANLAWLVSQWFAGQLNAAYGFKAIYLVSGATFIPLFFLVARRLIVLPKRTYNHTGIFGTIKRLLFAKDNSRSRDILRIISIDFVLQFFYAVMVIYLPIFLFYDRGFSWPQIGLILTIMLVPFVIIDLLLGRVADHMGEKEFIISGLVITGLATLSISLLSTSSILAWGGLLFATRVGAATIELMKESYLFKRVNSEDISIIFLSRSMYPLAYFIAPLVATLLLFFVPTIHLFTIVGVIVLASIAIIWKIKDTD